MKHLLRAGAFGLFALAAAPLVALSGSADSAVGSPLAINGTANFQSTTALPVELDSLMVE